MSGPASPIPTWESGGGGENPGPAADWSLALSAVAPLLLRGRARGPAGIRQAKERTPTGKLMNMLMTCKSDSNEPSSEGISEGNQVYLSFTSGVVLCSPAGGRGRTRINLHSLTGAVVFP